MNIGPSDCRFHHSECRVIFSTNRVNRFVVIVLGSCPQLHLDALNCSYIEWNEFCRATRIESTRLERGFLRVNGETAVDIDLFHHRIAVIDVAMNNSCLNRQEEQQQAMFLIQILLPLYDNSGNPFPQSEYLRVRNELTERFGGITTYVRSPAVGLWKGTRTKTIHDDIVIYEVMTEQLDRPWWREYRETLATRFLQDMLIVRVSEVDLI